MKARLVIKLIWTISSRKTNNKKRGLSYGKSMLDSLSKREKFLNVGTSCRTIKDLGNGKIEITYPKRNAPNKSNSILEKKKAVNKR